MFKNEFQGGPYVEVFSAQGRDPAAHWKLAGSVKKEFDKSIRSYAYVLEGGMSTTTTRMQLPKSEKSLLGLVQPCCVFQLMVPDTAKFTIDFTVLDNGGRRRRINLSTSQREITATPLNARVPLKDLHTDQWVHLCVGVASLTELLFKGSTFKSLEGISLGGSCKLRRIFTLQVTPASTDQSCLVSVPRSFHISSVEFVTQIVAPGFWTSLGNSDAEKPSHSTSDQQRPTHVAFGKKVAIPEHILTARLSTGQDNAEASSAMHPPTAPEGQPFLRIKRSKVRSVSGSKTRRSRATHPPSSTPQDNTHQDTNVQDTTHQDTTHQDTTLQDTNLQDTNLQDTNLQDTTLQDTGVHSSLTKDEELLVQLLRSEKALIKPTESITAELSSEQVYSFRSSPKSAERRVLPQTAGAERSSRGARLEEDFQPQTLTPPSSPLANTRLSDDYDWRQYASTEENNDQLYLSADESLRTRLAEQGAAPHPQLGTERSPHLASNNLEDTLSESMTLSGLAEHLKSGPQSSLLDSLETRTMGGMLSPVLLDTGQEPTSDGEGDTIDSSQQVDEIELMYDPQLNCFYDPLTFKYYELVQPD